MSNDQIKELRKSRKKILKQISHKIKEAKEKLAEDLVGEIENAKDDTKMFKAAKVLYTKHQRPYFRPFTHNFITQNTNHSNNMHLGRGH